MEIEFCTSIRRINLQINIPQKKKKKKESIRQEFGMTNTACRRGIVPYKFNRGLFLFLFFFFASHLQNTKMIGLQEKENQLLLCSEISQSADDLNCMRQTALLSSLRLAGSGECFL